jgi:hypothetical protein
MTRPQETALNHYPKRDAMCECEATHTWDGEPCISVRRAGNIDRCMECNKRWLARQASLALDVPCAKFRASGTPCSPVDGACSQCGNTRAA